MRKKSPSAIEIRDWTIRQIAQKLKKDPAEIDPKAPISKFNLDSVEIAQIAGALEKWLDRRIEPTLLWEVGTIEALAELLRSKKGTGA